MVYIHMITGDGEERGGWLDPGRLRVPAHRWPCWECVACLAVVAADPAGPRPVCSCTDPGRPMTPLTADPERTP